MRLFPLTISSVDALHFEGLVQSVTVPGSEGELTVLKDHAPLVTTLKKGVIRLRSNEGKEEFPLEQGLLEVSHGEATILL